LPLKSDLIFKLTFGDHRYIQIVRAFLIAALDIPAEEYEELEIIDPNLERDSPGDKLGILDVRVQLRSRKLVSVEIQVRSLPFMAERVAFSTCRNLSRQIGPGQSYSKIEKVVTIVIADYDMIGADESYHHTFKLYDARKKILLTEAIEIHTLELRKLPEAPGADDKEDELLNWLRLIRSEKEDEIEMLATKTPEMKMAVGRLKELSADERTRMLHEARELYLMDEATRREAAEAKGRAEGEAKGRAEGEAKGKAEGRAEGIAKGKAEGIAEGGAKVKLELARKMLARGLDAGTISEITGMTVGQIKQLNNPRGK
jgi:predicted transposase/invertase (TIGR01784 family)